MLFKTRRPNSAFFIIRRNRTHENCFVGITWNFEESLQRRVAPLLQAGPHLRSLSPHRTDKLAAECAGAQLVMLANMPLPGSVIEKCDDLKFLASAFTGVDHVDLGSCPQQRRHRQQCLRATPTAVAAELTVA